MSKFNMFFRLTKFDSIEGIFEAIATAEVEDKTGETCHYETTKPYYEKWSSEIEKASNGKSLGNIRAMHGNIAAGKVTALTFDDVQKVIRITGKIVDKAEKEKMAEGVYTGVSQGGDYVNKWKENGINYYTADPCEISLVDNPCLGIATFEYTKADGTTEMRKLNSIPDRKEIGKLLKQVWAATDGKTFDSKQEAVKYQADIDAAANINPLEKKAMDAANAINDILSKKEFSDEKRKEMAAKGEAMADGSFPIESAKDVENAVHDWGRTGSKADVKAHIMSRAKAIGAEGSLPDDWHGKNKEEKAKALGDLHKAACGDVFDASCAMDAMRILCNLMIREDWEVERGDSEEQAQVTMLEEAIDKIKEFIISELQEKDDDEKDDIIEIMMMAAKAGSVDVELLKADKTLSAALAKRGRHSKADAAKIAQMHDNVESMGDHVAKLGKMHKGMEDSHEEMGESTHAEGHAEMGVHLKKLGKHVEKMAACHKDMEMCMKGLGVGEEGKGGQNGNAEEPHEKMVKLVADNHALTKSIETITGAFEALQKRLETLEQEPKQTGNRPALFSLEKGNEIRKEENSGDVSVDAPLTNAFGSGLSPSQARRR